jgi:hypothetical protein
MEKFICSWDKWLRINGLLVQKLSTGDMSCRWNSSPYNNKFATVCLCLYNMFQYLLSFCIKRGIIYSELSFFQIFTPVNSLSNNAIGKCIDLMPLMQYSCLTCFWISNFGTFWFSLSCLLLLHLLFFSSMQNSILWPINLCYICWWGILNHSIL